MQPTTTPRVFVTDPSGLDFLGVGDQIIKDGIIKTYLGNGRFLISNSDIVLPGANYCVDSVNGNDGNTGLSWGAPFLTISHAISNAVAGDKILIKGSFSEAVTVSLAGVALIGVGTGPKMAQWTSATDTKTLTISANYVAVQNIYFKPPVYTADRATCSIKLSGANYAKILGNRFQGQTGSQIAIHSPVCDSDNVEIMGNDFLYMNTDTYGAAILGVEAGGLSYSGWKICDNRFNSCVIAINVGSRAALITGNTVQEYGVNAAGTVAAVMTLGIDLSGTSSGANSVWANQLGGTYNATLYKVGASGDTWGGNFNVISGGVTAANPA